MEVIDGEGDVAGLGHSEKMEHGVRGASEGHDEHHGVLEGGAGLDRNAGEAEVKRRKGEWWYRSVVDFAQACLSDSLTLCL